MQVLGCGGSKAERWPIGSHINAVQMWKIKYKENMHAKKLIVSTILMAWSQPSFADEKAADSIDWSSQSEIREILPLMQQHYRLSKASEPENLSELNAAGDEINIGVISDYAWLIAFAKTRPRPFPRPPFNKGKEFVTLVNFDAYEEHYHKIPDNITLFHSSYRCEQECIKMLFENRVKSITVANPEKQRAVRYFKTDCEKSFKWEKNRSRQPRPITTNSVLGLCYDKEAVDVPPTGFYFGHLSPLWPEAYKSSVGSKNYNRRIGIKQIFPERPHIKVDIVSANHWSALHPYSKKVDVIFERACFKVTPALPEKALAILVDTTTKVMKENKQGGAVYSISGTDEGFCYYPEWGSNIGQDKTINFFPNGGDTGLKLDIRRAMDPEEIVEKLKTYKLNPIENEATQMKNNRRSNFINTLKYLSSEYPDYYYDKIFPGILPRIFDSSSEGLGQAGTLVNLFHKAKPPVGSLSGYSEEVEALFEARLKDLGCLDWVCPETKEVEGGQYEFYNMIVGLGRSAFPIVTRMEKAGMKNTNHIAACIGGLTPGKKAEYYEAYKDRVSVGVGRLFLKDINLPKEKPKSFNAGRFFDDVAKVRTGRLLLTSSNLGYSINSQQVYFHNGIHPDVEAYLEQHDLMKNVQSIKRRNYDYAEALLSTEHGVEVVNVLENRLKLLKSEKAKGSAGDKLSFNGKPFTHGTLAGKTIVHGMNLNELATRGGQRTREIDILTEIIKNNKVNVDSCKYRPTKPFVFFP